jgi:uncharacterized protein (TIGR00297 family)
VIVRATIGFLLAALIALAGRLARSLSPSGAIAATIVGTISVAAGWTWGALLIVYFAASTALSHLGRAQKESRTASLIEKGGARDAAQVLANGATFAVAALFVLIEPDARWIALGAGSLAASAADTWATEIGTLYGGSPRSILTWRVIPVGTSGGMSLIGTLAAIVGAVFVALAAAALGWTWAVCRSVMIGGFAGALFDSLLGATVQTRRWCDACNRETERLVHDCGAQTRTRRGVSWMNNDIVNLLSNIVGGLLATTLWG